MAVIEPEKEKFSFGPLLLAGGVLLLMIGIGFGVYRMISGPKTRTITLSGEDAKKVGEGPINQQIPPGPPFPAIAAFPQAENPPPTMITVDLKAASVAQIAAELSKQAGVKIGSQNQDGGFLGQLLATRFDFAVANQPFWTALGELGKKGNVYPYLYDQRDQITLQSGGDANANCPTYDVGSCRLVLTGVTTRINAEVLTNNRSDRSLSVTMMLYVEPKIHAFRIGPIAKVETAVDEKGTSLIKPPDYWEDRNNGQQRNKYVQQVQCSLNFPANSGDKIAKLKGYASIITVGKDETITIKDPLKLVNADQKIDGHPLRVRRVAKQGTSNRYEALIQGDATSPFFKDWESLPKIAKLYDATGKELSPSGTGMGGGNKTIDAYLSFQGEPNQGPPTELRLTLPTQVKEIRVPFEFTNLPLPH